MIYGSICSGIEAATVAWEPLGWKAAWFSEIEAFPSAVLAERWPDVVNLGDMTKIAAAVRAGEVQAPDVMVGGTPCQAFSIAGLRNGLSDARGQLTLSYVELANAIDDKRIERGEEEAIFVWENVPGVLTSHDNAFGCFLAGLAGESCELKPSGGKWTHSGCVYGPQRTIAWIVKDAQYFGVAQRRKRVFVVASARKGFDPGQVLFESEGVRRDTPPSRETEKNIAEVTGHLATNGSHWDGENYPHPTLNQSSNIGGIGQSNQELFSQRGAGIVSAYRMVAFGEYADDETASTCKARDYKGATDLAVTYPLAVRRLMPVECERLQGFQDNHTQISWRGKEATECPDGPRYRAIGNSMAVPVMRWIGERIAAALPVKKSAGDYGGSKTPADQRDLWRTPPALFACLNAEFCFQLDAAAAPHNALCREFITAEQNTLETPWADYLSIPGYVWLNPPYSDITPFVKKAAAESTNQIGTVMLVPADTSVGWFKEAIQTASEVRFITAGRLAFINPVTGKPVSGNNKGSMLIIWHPYPRTHCHFSTVERDSLLNFGARLIAKREAA
ncbi:phage N-6-adenine-methyltransferase [Klebsiella variicola]|nr:phage N-6-adenine-methyltransferase [Klebsiella variicola]WKL60474.1 phage N-6-adenine-methyltransferase [Klebsiella variicola]